MNAIVAVFLGFAVKHFVVDFLLQGPYQWKNKGKFGHPGGILHSGLHALTTIAMFYLFVYLYPGQFLTSMIFSLALFEFVVHYLMDWSKVNINAYKGWGPTTHPEYWYLLGFDQFIHTITYVVMVEFFIF